MPKEAAIWVALFTAIPPTLVALAGLISSLRNKKTLNTVHTLVNSRLSEALAQIVELKVEVAELRKRGRPRS